MKASDRIAVFLLAASLVWMYSRGGVAVLQPVESPFPAEGFWLLVASESADLTGAKVAVNAESIRSYPGLSRRWFDYDKTPSEEPWVAALAWASDKSSGQPYFLVRKGGKAREGVLSGSASHMQETIAAALEAVQ